MRLVLLSLVLLSVAASAHAEGARESRYGPTVVRQTTSASVSYTGPMLSWASRPAAAPPVQPSYQPVAVASAARPPIAYAPNAYAPAATNALPDSLYAAPRSAPARQAAVAPSPVAQSPVAQSPIPQAPTAPRAQQVAAAAWPTGATGARFYSVGRESGLTPDPIPPIVADNRVLISAEAPASAPQDTAPAHGSADWLAAGVAGDDDQDGDGDARAKTRKQDQ